MPRRTSSPVAGEMLGEPDAIRPGQNLAELDATIIDTSALLRSAQKDRIDALVRGVQDSIYSPHEARNLEGLDSVAWRRP
jgi:hypothetical protein